MNQKKKRLRVWVTDEITRELQSELGVTGTTVLAALRFYNNSPLAKKIRSLAMSKMDAVVKANRDLMKQFD